MIINVVKLILQFIVCYSAYGTAVNQTIIIRDIGFNASPRTVECPNCHNLITTQATYTSGGLTWLASGLICLFGLVCLYCFR
jgi:hypothetical protein